MEADFHKCLFFQRANGAVTQHNFLCDLFRNAIARQVARNIAQPTHPATAENVARKKLKSLRKVELGSTFRDIWVVLFHKGSKSLGQGVIVISPAIPPINKNRQPQKRITYHRRQEPQQSKQARTSQSLN